MTILEGGIFGTDGGTGGASYGTGTPYDFGSGTGEEGSYEFGDSNYDFGNVEGNGGESSYGSPSGYDFSYSPYEQASYSNEGNNYQNANYAPSQYKEEDFLDQLFRRGKGMAQNMAISKAMKAAGVPGWAGAAYNIGQGIANGQPGPAIRNTMFGLAGGMLGGPLGAMAGGQISNMLGESTRAPDDSNFFTADGREGSSMMRDLVGTLTRGDTLGQLATGAIGAYQGNRAAKAADGTINNINNLYSPNSPYAQQMRQAMERKDAAAGRRSQYGTRETELAGLLTQAHSGALTSGGYGNLLQQRNQQRSRGTNNLIALLQSAEGKKLMGQGGSALSRMFSGSGQAPQNFQMGNNFSLPSPDSTANFNNFDAPDMGYSYDFGG